MSADIKSLVNVDKTKGLRRKNRQRILIQHLDVSPSLDVREKAKHYFNLFYFGKHWFKQKNVILKSL